MHPLLQPWRALLLFDSYNMHAYTSRFDAEMLPNFFQLENLAGNDVTIRREIFHNILISSVYQLKPYTGRTILYRASETIEPFTMLIHDPFNGWKNLVTPTFEIHSINCNHCQLFFKNWAK